MLRAYLSCVLRLFHRPHAGNVVPMSRAGRRARAAGRMEPSMRDVYDPKLFRRSRR